MPSPLEARIQQMINAGASREDIEKFIDEELALEEAQSVGPPSPEQLSQIGVPPSPSIPQAGFKPRGVPAPPRVSGVPSLDISKWEPESFGGGVAKSFLSGDVPAASGMSGVGYLKGAIVDIPQSIVGAVKTIGNLAADPIGTGSEIYEGIKGFPAHVKEVTQKSGSDPFAFGEMLGQLLGQAPILPNTPRIIRGGGRAGGGLIGGTGRIMKDYQPISRFTTPWPFRHMARNTEALVGRGLEGVGDTIKRWSTPKPPTPTTIRARTIPEIIPPERRLPPSSTTYVNPSINPDRLLPPGGITSPTRKGTTFTPNIESGGGIPEYTPGKPPLVETLPSRGIPFNLPETTTPAGPITSRPFAPRGMGSEEELIRRMQNPNQVVDEVTGQIGTNTPPDVDPGVHMAAGKDVPMNPETLTLEKPNIVITPAEVNAARMTELQNQGYQYKGPDGQGNYIYEPKGSPTTPIPGQNTPTTPDIVRNFSGKSEPPNMTGDMSRRQFSGTPSPPDTAGDVVKFTGGKKGRTPLPGEKKGTADFNQSTYHEDGWEHYRLPDGRILPMRSDLSRGDPTVTFGLKNGEIVEAKRIPGGYTPEGQLTREMLDEEGFLKESVRGNIETEIKTATDEGHDVIRPTDPEIQKVSPHGIVRTLSDGSKVIKKRQTELERVTIRQQVQQVNRYNELIRKYQGTQNLTLDELIELGKLIDEPHIKKVLDERAKAKSSDLTVLKSPEEKGFSGTPEPSDTADDVVKFNKKKESSKVMPGEQKGVAKFEDKRPEIEVFNMTDGEPIATFRTQEDTNNFIKNHPESQKLDSALKGDGWPKKLDASDPSGAKAMLRNRIERYKEILAPSVTRRYSDAYYSQYRGWLKEAEKQLAELEHEQTAQAMSEEPREIGDSLASKSGIKQKVDEVRSLLKEFRENKQGSQLKLYQKSIDNVKFLEGEKNLRTAKKNRDELAIQLKYAQQEGDGGLIERLDLLHSVAEDVVSDLEKNITTTATNTIETSVKMAYKMPEDNRSISKSQLADVIRETVPTKNPKLNAILTRMKEIVDLPEMSETLWEELRELGTMIRRHPDTSQEFRNKFNRTSSDPTGKPPSGTFSDADVPPFQDPKYLEEIQRKIEAYTSPRPKSSEKLRAVPKLEEIGDSISGGTKKTTGQEKIGDSIKKGFSGDKEPPDTASDMSRSPKKGKIEVKKIPNSSNWGLYVDDQLHEGGWFSRESAERGLENYRREIDSSYKTKADLQWESDIADMDNSELSRRLEILNDREDYDNPDIGPAIKAIENELSKRMETKPKKGPKQ